MGLYLWNSLSTLVPLSGGISMKGTDVDTKLLTFLEAQDKF
jgi:hypothetical protein